jgi:hypothetical protein
MLQFIRQLLPSDSHDAGDAAQLNVALVQDPKYNKYLVKDAILPFMSMGGVRLEDNVVVTATGSLSLTGDGWGCCCYCCCCVPLLCVPLLCVSLLCVPLLCVPLLCVPLLCAAVNHALALLWCVLPSVHGCLCCELPDSFVEVSASGDSVEECCEGLCIIFWGCRH